MNYRIYVEKRNKFDIESEELLKDIKLNVSINGIENVKIINLYDVFNMDETIYLETKNVVFSNKVSDIIYEQFDLNTNENKHIFAVEYLPGQYDQRADSAKQCIDLLMVDNDKYSEIDIRSGKLIILYGKLTEIDVKKIKNYYINKVEMRDKNLQKLEQTCENPTNKLIPIINDFRIFSDKQLNDMKKNMGLAMTLEDLKHIKTYFVDIEKRNPTETEIRVLDTYWSDHCRHTTFETIIEGIEVEDGKYKEIFEKSINEYILSREFVYGDKEKDRANT